MNKPEQVKNLQLLTFLVNEYNYQIVQTNGLQTDDYWLMNMKHQYPLICITHRKMDAVSAQSGSFRQLTLAITSTFHQPGKLLILSTNEQAQDFIANDVTQHVVVVNRPVASELIRAFPGIEKASREVKNVHSETRNLTRLLQKKARSEMWKEMKRTKSVPINTIIVAVICLVLFIAANLLTFITHDSVVSSIFAGAYYKMSVVSAHEYWRLITAGFVHYDFFHILMNLIALLNLGLILERRLTPLRYWILLLISILVGNLFVFVGDGNVVGLGISGGLFGFLGAIIVFYYVEGAFKNPRILSNFITTVTMNILISLLPGISMLAHLGGFVAGLAVGVVFVNAAKMKSFAVHTVIAFGLLIGLCISRIPSLQTIQDIYGQTDLMIMQTAYDLNLDFYGDYLYNSFCGQMEKQGISEYRLYIDANLNR